MLPRERVAKTLSYEEPDLVPWGEHSIDYTTYEMVLGRPSLVQGKMKQTRAMWEGRRDEVAGSYARDIPDLAEALGFDIVTIGRVPAAGARETPMKQLDEETFEDAGGNLYRISKTTHDLCLYKANKSQPYQPPTVEQLQEQIDRLDATPLERPDDSVWEAARAAMDRLKATHWFNICVGDIGFPMIGRDDEERYLNMALYPELHAKLTELSAKSVIRQLPLYAEMGYDSIMPCGDLGSSTGLLASPQILREHVVYWWQQYTGAAKALGLRVIKHCCGCVWEAIECMIDGGYEGYEAIQQSGGMDLKRLKEMCGQRLVLWGAPGGGFIYGASHSLAVGTKLENLMKMKAMRDRYGVYPISVPE